VILISELVSCLMSPRRRCNTLNTQSCWSFVRRRTATVSPNRWFRHNWTHRSGHGGRGRLGPDRRPADADAHTPISRDQATRCNAAAVGSINVRSNADPTASANQFSPTLTLLTLQLRRFWPPAKQRGRVCLSDDNFRKPWRIGNSYSHIWCISGNTVSS